MSVPATNVVDFPARPGPDPTSDEPGRICLHCACTEVASLLERELAGGALLVDAQVARECLALAREALGL